jgi:hypothetical protein
MKVQIETIRFEYNGWRVKVTPAGFDRVHWMAGRRGEEHSRYNIKVKNSDDLTKVAIDMQKVLGPDDGSPMMHTQDIMYILALFIPDEEET